MRNSLLVKKMTTKPASSVGTFVSTGADSISEGMTGQQGGGGVGCASSICLSLPFRSQAFREEGWELQSPALKAQEGRKVWLAWLLDSSLYGK